MFATQLPAARRRPRRPRLVAVELVEDERRPPETVERRSVRVPDGLVLVATLAAAAVVLVVGTSDRTPADATTGCPGSVACEVVPGSAVDRGPCQWQGYAATVPDVCAPAHRRETADPCATAGSPSAETECRQVAAADDSQYEPLGVRRQAPAGG